MYAASNKNETTRFDYLLALSSPQNIDLRTDDDEYTDFQLSKYPFIGKVFDDGFYWGAIETIKEIDERMYFKFKSNNVNKVAILALYAGEKPLGAIGISFCGQKQMDASAVGKAIRKCGIQVATLLSN